MFRTILKFLYQINLRNLLLFLVFTFWVFHFSRISDHNTLIIYLQLASYVLYVSSNSSWPSFFVLASWIGLGFVTSITFIFLVGVFMSSWLGASVLGLGEWFIKRMPFVRHIYNASKQISSAISSGGYWLFVVTLIWLLDFCQLIVLFL